MQIWQYENPQILEPINMKFVLKYGTKLYLKTTFGKVQHDRHYRQSVS